MAARAGCEESGAILAGEVERISRRERAGGEERGRKRKRGRGLWGREHRDDARRDSEVGGMGAGETVDGEHGGAGGVGSGGEPVQRSRGCGVWSDDGGAADGVGGSGEDGGIIHQHVAGASASGGEKRSKGMVGGVAAGAGGGAGV